MYPAFYRIPELDTRRNPEYDAKSTLVIPIPVHTFSKILWYLGSGDMGSQFDRCDLAVLFFVEKTPACQCNGLEPCACACFISVCGKLGLCPPSAIANINLCKRRFETKNFHHPFIRPCMVWNGACANARVQSQPLFLVGSVMVSRHVCIGHKLED